MEIEDGSIHMLRNSGREGLSTEADGVCNGRNSGYQAVNLAVLAGAKRIVLLGYDMRFQNGKQHWFGNHPIPNVEHDFTQNAKHFRTMVEPLRELGVEVVNCSPGTFIDAFPRVPLDLVRWA